MAALPGVARVIATYCFTRHPGHDWTWGDRHPMGTKEPQGVPGAWHSRRHTCVPLPLRGSLGESSRFLNCMKRGAPFFLLGPSVGLADPRATVPKFPCTESLVGTCCTCGSVAIAKPPFSKQKCQKRIALISFPSETGSAL